MGRTKFTKPEPTQVRCTGDWSSDSKLSAIQNGYWEDPYFEILNKPQEGSLVRKRTSLICRGYCVRFRVCDYAIKKIIRDMDGPFQIVSLGCGMDSMFFRLIPELHNLSRFYELDFPTVISKKIEIISAIESLHSLANPKLVLIPADLRNLPLLRDILTNADFDFEIPTIFYSECVVNYLKSNENDAILHWIIGNIPKCIWVAYEQCFPDDAFGQIMVSHFQRNGCPILSIQEFGDMKQQKQQLCTAGFRNCEVFNVWDFFIQIANEDPTNVINSSHQFDEYEAFIATCLHYTLRIGSNVKLKLEHKSFESPEVVVNTLNIVPMGSLDFPVTGHCGISIGQNALIIGGTNQHSQRLPEARVYSIADENFLSSTAVAKSSNFERVNACTVMTQSSKVIYLFGGRKSPETTCDNELIKVLIDGSNIVDSLVTLSSPDRPCSRWRHSMVSFIKGDQEFLLLFGGKTVEQEALDDCWLFDTQSSNWSILLSQNLNTSDPCQYPSPRHSHSACNDPKRSSIFIVGGISGNGLSLCEDALWQYNYKIGKWHLWNQNNLVAQKCGAVTLVHEDNLLILGGYGNSSCMISEHFLAVVNLETKVELLFRLEFGTNEIFLPFGFSVFLIGDEGDNPSLLVFGGGGNCFSFGTHFNKLIFNIKLPVIRH